MRPPDGNAYLFDPGALCLELLVTGGPGEFARWESLHAPEDLTDWLARSRLHLDSSRVRVSADDVTAARALRNAITRMVRGHLREEPHTPEDVGQVNLAAEHPPLVPRLSDGARSWSLPCDAAQALSTVARDAVDLFTGGHAHRIRECAAHDCQLLFVDVSRPGRRRWCSMDRCGNRAKIRALRERRGS